MTSVPPASAGGSNTQRASCLLDQPAYAGGTDFITRFDAPETRACAHLFAFLNSEPIDQSRNDRFGKAARHALHRRIFFVKEVARVIGEFELATKNKILIVVEHAVFMAVAHGHRGGDGDFKNACAALVIEQYA